MTQGLSYKLGVYAFAEWQGGAGASFTLIYEDALSGRCWFLFLTSRRWEKITALQLAESFSVLFKGQV